MVHFGELPRRARRSRRLIYVVAASTAQRKGIAETLLGVGDLCREVLGLKDVSIRDTRDSAAVVILVDDGISRVCSRDELREFRREDGATPVLLLSRESSLTMHQLADLTREGLDGLELFGAGLGEELRRTVTRRLRNALPSSLVDGILPNNESIGRSILALCLRIGWSSPSVADVASWLQWDRKTIWRHLHESGLRPLHHLIDIGRLAHGAVRLDESQAKVGIIAQGLGVDVATFRRLCKRETRLSPKQLQRQGAVQTLVERISIYKAPR